MLLRQHTYFHLNIKKNIIQSGTEENIYYTNSSQVPVNHTDDPFEALLLQDELQCKYTGGTVLHLYMREKLSSAEACRNLVKKVLSNFRLPYITVTPVFSICPTHGYLSGEHEYCPKCDEILLEKLTLNHTHHEHNNQQAVPSTE